MFGYIKPDMGELKVKEYDLYKSAYCGLCHALHHKAGCLATLALNYDLVFLLLVSFAINDETIEIKNKRCPIHPFKAVPTIEINESSIKVAQVNTLLTYYKIVDDIKDENVLKKILMRMVQPFVYFSKSRAKIEAGLETNIKESLEELRRKELNRCKSPDEMAELFGKVLSQAFEYVACDDKKQVALSIGNIIGKWIYYVDAIDDYEKDKKHNHYNPFLVGELLPKDNLRDVLLLTLKDIDGSFLFIDFKNAEIENIIKNIVYLGMPQVGNKVIYKLQNEEKVND